MINEKSLEAVARSTFSKNFCKPLYESYCFSKIPQTIENLLLGKTQGGLPLDVTGESKSSYDHVVLILLDGFGWTFLEKYHSQIPFFKVLEKQGIVSKLTSLFPSTTAAHITCINTGLIPSQSGLYEWFIYEPKLNDLIAPLPYSFAGDHHSESLVETILKPEDLYPQTTLYEKFKEKGITSFAFQPASIASSVYSNSILKGAEVIGYQTIEEGFHHLLSSLKEKSYSYFYYPDIDSIGHREGITGEAFFNKIKEVFSKIEDFYQKLPPRTALLITADHGMTEVNPSTTYYINRKIPNIESHLIYGNRRKPLAPAGSCRDFFLHVKKDHLSELKEILEIFLKDKAEVYFTETLIDEGFFGLEPPSENFLSRVGNLVILPYKGEGIWWYEKNRFQQNFFGAHGGLTREEMEIPLLFLPI